MNLTEVYAIQSGKKKKKRIGRGPGSGHGKTATRGHKGQKARKGYTMRETFEGGQTPLFRRLPKRGFSNVQFTKVYSIINVGDLQDIDQSITEISIESLVENGLLRKTAPNGLKVLADGELTRALTVKARKFSAKAVEKIQAAGGKVEVID
jgi:large subunit ribosomal protein L15